MNPPINSKSTNGSNACSFVAIFSKFKSLNFSSFGLAMRLENILVINLSPSERDAVL